VEYDAAISFRAGLREYACDRAASKDEEGSRARLLHSERLLVRKTSSIRRVGLHA
jgi:hypothetical protein